MYQIPENEQISIYIYYLGNMFTYRRYCLYLLNELTYKVLVALIWKSVKFSFQMSPKQLRSAYGLGISVQTEIATVFPSSSFLSELRRSYEHLSDFDLLHPSGCLSGQPMGLPARWVARLPTRWAAQLPAWWAAHLSVQRAALRSYQRKKLTFLEQISDFDPLRPTAACGAPDGQILHNSRFCE